MKDALQALVTEMEYVLTCINAHKVPFDGDDFHEALRLGREALAQPEQEPAIFLKEWSDWRNMVVQNLMRNGGVDKDLARRLAHFYQDAAPQRKPLTDEQKMALCKQFPEHLTYRAIEAIEAAHGIKGNA